MKFSLILTSLLVCACVDELRSQPAWELREQANWKFVDTNVNGDTLYISPRVEMPSGHLRVWERLVNKDTGTVIGTDRRKSVKEQLILEEFDCATERVRVLNLMNYQYDGRAHSQDSTRIWTYIVPGSLGESTLRELCHNELPHRRANVDWEE